MEGLKIVFTGPHGAGKTTAIQVVSDAPPITTDTGPGALDGLSTTAAFDYGECRSDDGRLLRLYGTPGQARFDFMWELLAQGAIGLVVLLDDRRPDPAADALECLADFPLQASQGAAVVGIGRFGATPPQVHRLAQQIEAQGYRVPVVEVDVRRHDDVRMLLRILEAQLEVCG